MIGALQIQTMFNQWCTIESDPAVFTELVKQIGAPTVQVEQVYSLEEDDLLTRVKPQIHGLIFLFKWTKSVEKRDSLLDYDEDLFFARQVVHNACATQAILSVLLNAAIPIEGHIKQFHDFAKYLNCEDRGLALSNSEAIRKLHNSFSRPEPFLFKEDKRKKQKEADIYHFVSYVPHKGNVYELDGLQPGPILIGKYEGNDWVGVARQEIQQRIEKYSEKEIRFNLMVVCEDLKLKNQRQMDQLALQRASIAKRCRTLGLPYPQHILQTYPQVLENEAIPEDQIQEKLLEIGEAIEEKGAWIQAEEVRRQQRKEENIRRKHNYVPLIIQVLKTLARKGKIGEVIEKVKKPQKQ